LSALPPAARSQSPTEWIRMASILYVDDEATIRRAVHYWLDRRGHNVHSARSVSGAKRCMTLHHFDGIFIDVWLGDGSGLDLHAWLRAHDPRLAEETVFVTGDLLMKPETRDRLIATGRPVLEKPFDLLELDVFVQKWDTRRPNPPEQGTSLRA
jgi:DNA-binding NtrC family response regulator